MATCLDYSLKYIHIYPKTEQELRTKLFTKKYTELEIDKTIEFLKSKWYIDDVQFTKLYIESELVKKWKIPMLVINKLLHKGVDKTIINKAVQSAERWIQEGTQNRILKEVEKYKKRWLDGYEIMVKISQRGYRISDIKKALASRE
jgi:regulatory protein